MWIKDGKIIEDKDDRIEFFVCQCHSLDHSWALRIWDFSDNNPAKECARSDFVYFDIEVILDHFRNFRERLWFVTKYIFGQQKDNHFFSGNMGRICDIPRIIKICEEYKLKIQEWKDANNYVGNSVVKTENGIIFTTENEEHEIVMEIVDDKDFPPWIDVSVRLPLKLNFFERFVAGMRYAFGHLSRAGSCQSAEISPAHADAIIELCNQMKNTLEKEWKYEWK